MTYQEEINNRKKEMPFPRKSEDQLNSMTNREIMEYIRDLENKVENFSHQARVAQHFMAQMKDKFNNFLGE